MLPRAATFISKKIDMPALLDAAAAAPVSIPTAGATPPPGQRIALARDDAFSFVYPHLIAAWRQAGANILAFSPLGDQGPDDSADCCWLPGGYPELPADKIAAPTIFRTRSTDFAKTRSVHGAGRWLDQQRRGAA